MREEFTLANDALRQRGIVSVCRDWYMEPKRRGSVYFVRSPKTEDKHESLCLYPDSDRYVDYANGNASGDIVSLISYTKECSQWEALLLLRDYYGLPGEQRRYTKETRQQMREQQEKERKKAKRQQEFRAALSACIDYLKRWEVLYQRILDEHLHEPVSDARAYFISRLQRVNYKLDVLCGIDAIEYPSLKSGSGSYFQWLLDALAILEKEGIFIATESELRKIKSQIRAGGR